MDETTRLKLVALLEGIQQERGSVYRDTISHAGAQYRLVTVEMADWDTRHDAMQQARRRAEEELARARDMAVAALQVAPCRMTDSDAAATVQADCERIASLSTR